MMGAILVEEMFTDTSRDNGHMRMGTELRRTKLSAKQFQGLLTNRKSQERGQSQFDS